MSKKAVLSIFRSVSILFLNIWKWCNQKYCPKYFKICKYAFFEYVKKKRTKTVLGIFRFIAMLFKHLKTGMSKKIVSAIFGFLSILFQIFENCVTYFHIRKYVFLNIWKGYEKKNFPRYFQIINYGFLKIFE